MGNRLSGPSGGAYNYNASNELTSIGSVTFAYDNNGNRTSTTSGGGTTTFSWDYENRLTSVALPGSGGTFSFTYDPFGRRIKVVSPSGTIVYAYDGDNIVDQMDATGTWQSRFTHGLGVDEPLEIRQQSVPLYYHADGLGSIAAVTNASRAVAASYTYDSFGRWSVQTQIATSPYGFTGREFDTGNGATPGPGLYYYRARYYDPSVGRFLSEDPVRSASGGFEFYAYVGNNPANYRDPRGLVRIDPTFPTSCRPGLVQAVNIVRRAAELNPECNCQFKHMGDGRSLLDLLNDPGITIHYDPVQQPPTPPETGTIGAYTEPGDAHNIWAEPYGCKMGRWTMAAFLVHELTHIALTPALGQEGAASAAQVACGFRLTVTSPTIVVRP